MNPDFLKAEDVEIVQILTIRCGWDDRRTLLEMKSAMEHGHSIRTPDGEIWYGAGLSNRMMPRVGWFINEQTVLPHEVR